MKNNIVVQKTKPFPRSEAGFNLLSDAEWKKYILMFLMQYCKELDLCKISKIIKEERRKKRSCIESAIKTHLREWFKYNRKFKNYRFIINREPHSESYKVGFYDLKFQHSYWNYGNTYFAFECKNIEADTKSKLNASIKEYIYNPSKNDGDGGVYRYLTKKYSPEQDFGGMIGFLISGNLQKAIDKIINKLETLDISDKHIGKLADNGIVKNSLAGNRNTFDSTHNCYNDKNEVHSAVLLHHIIIDFQTN